MDSSILATDYNISAVVLCRTINPAAIRCCFAEISHSYRPAKNFNELVYIGILISILVSYVGSAAMKASPV
jgi:hypothetical protein